MRRKILWFALGVTFGLLISSLTFAAAEASFQSRPANASQEQRVLHSSYASVDRWKQTALNAGWTRAQWPWVRCVMYRESRGNPRVYSRSHDFGLMQINRIWIPKLKKAGIIRTASDLYKPYVNLRAARYVYKVQGRQAWASSRRPC